MLTLKQKVKCHFMKRNDYVLEGNKQQNTSSFLFFASKFLSFFVFRMNVEGNFVVKLQRQSKEILEVEKRKTREIETTARFCKYFAFVVYVSKKRSTISFSYLFIYFFFSKIFSDIQV